MDESLANDPFQIEFFGWLHLPKHEHLDPPFWETDIEEILSNNILAKYDILCSDVTILSDICEQGSSQEMLMGATEFKLKLRFDVDSKSCNYRYPEVESQCMSYIALQTLKNIFEVGFPKTEVAITQELAAAGADTLALVYIFQVPARASSRIIPYFENIEMRAGPCENPNRRYSIKEGAPKLTIAKQIPKTEWPALNTSHFIKFTINLSSYSDCWKLLECIAFEGRGSLTICGADLELYSARANFLDASLSAVKLAKKSACFGHLTNATGKLFMELLNNALNKRPNGSWSSTAAVAVLPLILEYWCCEFLFFQP